MLRRWFWVRWAAFFNERQDGTTLALLRIALGISLLYSIGSVVLHGMVPVIWLGPHDGGYTSPGQGPWLFHWIGGLTPTTLWAVVVATLLGGLLLVLGLGGRLAALVALLGYQNLIGSNGETLGAYDWLLTNALWLVFLSRSTATLSLDCRLRTGRWTSTEAVPAWPRYLAVYQIVLVYWSTGIHKLSRSWVPGGGFSAIYYILQEPTWQRWDMTWLAPYYPLTQIATAVTWIWEISAPLLLLVLWYRHTADRPGRLRALCNRLPLRGLWVAAGVAMHGGIMLFMDVGPFSAVSLSYYVCLFHPAEWRSFGVRLRNGAHCLQRVFARRFVDRPGGDAALCPTKTTPATSRPNPPHIATGEIDSPPLPLPNRPAESGDAG